MGFSYATRKFADALESEGRLTSGTDVTLSNPVAAQDGSYSATVSLQAGIYVFIDSAVATGSVTQAIPMIVASGTVADKVLTDPIRGRQHREHEEHQQPRKDKGSQ